MGAVSCRWATSRTNPQCSKAEMLTCSMAPSHPLCSHADRTCANADRTRTRPATRSRNLLTPIIIHGTWNSAVLTLLFGLAASGIDVEAALREMR